MKHIKLFEKYKNKELKKLCKYLDKIIPFSKEDGFIECLYSKYNSFVFQFFSIDMNENKEKMFFDFLKNNNIKYITMQTDIYGDSFYNCDINEYIVEISDEQIEKFIELRNNSKKYNL